MKRERSESILGVRLIDLLQIRIGELWIICFDEVQKLFRIRSIWRESCAFIGVVPNEERHRHNFTLLKLIVQIISGECTIYNR